MGHNLIALLNIWASVSLIVRYITGCPDYRQTEDFSAVSTPIKRRDGNNFNQTLHNLNRLICRTILKYLSDIKTILLTLENYDQGRILKFERKIY